MGSGTGGGGGEGKRRGAGGGGGGAGGMSGGEHVCGKGRGGGGRKSARGRGGRERSPAPDDCDRAGASEARSGPLRPGRRERSPLRTAPSPHWLRSRRVARL